MHPSIYVIFAILTIVLVALDVWQTKDGKVTLKKAISWSLFWFLLAFAFAVSIYFFWNWYAPNSIYTNQKAAIAFTTGYLLEKSLSVDNLFVFAIIFQQYQVPESLRARALLWGVLGALILRAAMILIGSSLIEQYHGVLYLFAVFLIWTGISLAIEKEAPSINPLPERVIRKVVPCTKNYHGSALLIKQRASLVATPMLVVIGVIAFMDVMFALDSIPAIFAVTQEPFLVLTANVFALLGLRSLYFVLQGMMNKFVYLKSALAAVMMFIGIKMLLVGTSWAIPTVLSLMFLLAVMTAAIFASILKPKLKKSEQT
ncbi:TerC/Alx family metal homeostasis membrane protein [Vibrio sonorensis]|uniref:TerC/Alx family metal homeostasis membrane protein n=1 Tax=Vibrio sonorensis TaxID=1004316 RepID=UPI0008D9AB75|nr:TerC/Alx family metal homeostasis membrane protein [Vibrio sonorensis]